MGFWAKYSGRIIIGGIGAIIYNLIGFVIFAVNTVQITAGNFVKIGFYITITNALLIYVKYKFNKDIKNKKESNQKIKNIEDLENREYIKQIEEKAIKFLSIIAHIISGVLLLIVIIKVKW